MECKPQIKENSYDFFDDIENYINKTKGNPGRDDSAQISSKCDGFSQTWLNWFKNKQIAISACEEIIKLYKSLNNIKPNPECSKDHMNDCRFFNYWVNVKIAQGRSNESVCIEDIYNGIESQFTGSDFYNMFDVGVIYDIDKDELNKMNILYSLYEKYTKLKTIIDTISEQNKKQLITLSTVCCPDYIEANYICNDGNDDDINSSTFCKNLKTFRSKYEDLYTSLNTKKPEFSGYFTRLSECPNNKIITTAVTGTFVGLIPLFAVLYKFTPMGQVLRSRIGIMNNDISNTDEDMANISLIEQENEQLKFQKGTYNIKYQSL